MNESLTVVLPLHNAEETLRRSVDHVLEVAAELTANFRVLIVDDGSTDDSFDVATEIATEYPQVKVVRQSQRRGLGPTLNAVKRMVKSDVVMVHDGVSTANAEQLRVLWNQRPGVGQPADVSAADLLRPSQNQAAMAVAHQRLMNFQFLSVDDNTATHDTPAPKSRGRKAAATRNANAGSVGAIPPLPGPNFMGAVGDFARGE